MTDRCDLTELLVAQCACPQHRGGRSIEQQATTEALEERSRLIITGQWFPAKYAGNCGRCGEPFPEGTTIHHDRSRDVGYIAECCAEEPSHGR